jgi:hypothetical protein
MPPITPSNKEAAQQQKKAADVPAPASGDKPTFKKPSP